MLVNLIFNNLFLGPKVDVNLKISSIGVVQRTNEIGNTPLLKNGKFFNSQTSEFETRPYVENKQIIATTTTV